MNGFPIAWKSLRDQRLSAALAGLVGSAIALLDVLIYPEYREQLEDFELPDALKGFLGEAGSLTTPEGFMAAEFFSWIPLVLITIAIIAGTGALAGEEGSGTLELLLAQPVRRWRLMAEKAAGVAAALAVAAFLTYPGFALGKAVGDMPLGYGRFAVGVVSMLPVTFLFLALAMAAAAALPDRGAAAVLCIGVVVVTYLLNTVGAAVDSLEAARKVTPFYWADGGHVLIHGFSWERSGGLLLATALLFGLGLLAFERRDIASGGELSLARLWRAVRLSHHEEAPAAR